MKQKYKRGDKHPDKDLIFFQYHPELKGRERWLTPKEFEKQKKLHAESTRRSRWGTPLQFLVSNNRSRDKVKYSSPEDQLIDLIWVEEQLQKQDGKCYWFGVKMEITFSETLHKRLPLKISIDRLDCSKGYTKDNCVLCCYAANCGRGNATVDEWKKSIKIIKDGLQNI